MSRFTSIFEPHTEFIRPRQDAETELLARETHMKRGRAPKRIRFEIFVGAPWRPIA